MSGRAHESRLEDLEMRVAHQERTLDELNSALTAQWDRIDALLRHVALLQDRMREAEIRATTGALPEAPPPHY